MVKKIIALVLAVSSAITLANTSVFAADKEGISLSKPITTSYQKDQVINIDGTDYTNLPEVSGGKIEYKYIPDGSSSLSTREIDIQQAVINYIKNSTSSSLDRIKIDGFSTTEGVNTNKKYVNKTMTLTFMPKDSSNEYTTEISYRVYSSSEAMAGMQQVTKILATLNRVLDNILAPLLMVMIAVGMIFAIFLGIKLAKANNAEEREEAKKRVIYTVIGIAVCVALILVFKLFAKFSIEWLGDSNFFDLPLSK